MQGGSFLPEVDIMEMLLLACASHKTGRENPLCVVVGTHPHHAT